MLTFFFAFASLYLPSALAAGGALGFLIVSDPIGVVQCDQYNLTWQGGVPPFSVQVEDPAEAGNIYAFFADVEDEFVLWDANNLGVEPGSFPLAFLVAVTDSTATTATSKSESIQPATIPLDSSGQCTTIVTSSSSDSGPSSSPPSTPASSSTPSSSPSSTTPSLQQSDSAQSQTSTSPTSSAPSGGSSSASTVSHTSSPASAPNVSETTTAKKKISSGDIAGVVVGGIVLISLLGTIFAWLRRRHQKAILDELTENDYHLTLYGKNPPPPDVPEKPLPAFYEPMRPGSAAPTQSSSASQHDAFPAIQSGYLPASESQLAPYHSAPHPPPLMPQPQMPLDVASQQMELERQINVMQREINDMQYTNAAGHTQALQNQVNAMRGELERMRTGQAGYR
ncbi:hypothetical protein MSAN_01061500 [Mycena sanguinolenta]|uniref:Uncharacterized protein n=1 Tax=Mycena sanguinolenta TaxID=230812 RepID=A0A8H6YPX3_9AGAR|nr:hypothetical protein MSAN_01061500 [Mycena sanguinolenta]